jgi:Tol biopolymer transport system component
VNTDGSGEREITAGLVPTWAPEGNAIAFQNRNPDNGGRFDIYSIAIDSFGNADPTSVRNLTNSPEGDIHPNWSPDPSRRIVFQSNRDFFDPVSGTYAMDRFELYLMNADGSNQVQFTCVGGWSTTPAWSPDGRKIAFGHLDPPTSDAPTALNFNIYVKDANDIDCYNLGRRLTDSPRIDTKPSWSANGAMIAFESVREVDGVVQGTQIYIMNSDGTNQVPLTELSANGRPNMSPTWGPLPRRADSQGSRP